MLSSALDMAIFLLRLGSRHDGKSVLYSEVGLATSPFSQRLVIRSLILYKPPQYGLDIRGPCALY